MIHGRYRDLVTDERRRVRRDSGWHSNVIAQSAWTVVSALLRNDAAMRGVLFCAVGGGVLEWDKTPPTPRATTTRLCAELERRPLAAKDFAYIDPRGGAASRPTDRLEITARFAVTESRVLREFGLFGGDATVTPNSGYLINYVVHPRFELKPGSTLTRRVRLTLRPSTGGSEGDLLILPAHWLARESPRLLDGIGDAYAAALEKKGVKTIGALAELDLARAGEAVPLAKAVELRSKARLALRTAATLVSIPSLSKLTAWDIVSTPLSELGGDVSQTALETLREQMSALQLALDARYLKRATVGELAEKTRA